MNTQTQFRLALVVGIVVTIAGSLFLVNLSDAPNLTPTRVTTRPAVAVSTTTSVPIGPTAPSGQTVIVPSVVPEPTRPVQPSATATPSPIPPITVTVTNEHCENTDYYVDGKRVVSALGEGATTSFQAAPGNHAVHVCRAGTQECADDTPANWTSSVVTVIQRGVCPLTVTITNRHCKNEDVYVDDDLVGIALGQGAQVVFRSTAGEHTIQACPAGTQDCGEPSKITWTRSITLTIDAGPDCR
jgi:hypothetical protein